MGTQMHEGKAIRRRLGIGLAPTYLGVMAIAMILSCAYSGTPGEEDSASKIGSGVRTESQAEMRRTRAVDEELAAMLESEVEQWRTWIEEHVSQNAEISPHVLEAAEKGLRWHGDYLEIPRAESGQLVENKYVWVAQYYQLAPKPCVIFGQVLDQDGRPFPGAVVKCTYYLLLQRGNRASCSLEPVQADEQGTFAYPDLPEGTYRLVARAPGYLGEDSGRFPVTSDESPKAVKLRLHRGTTSRGLVLDPEGKPVVGVPVKIHTYKLPFRGPGNHTYPPLSEDVTDEQGRFEIEYINYGAYDLRFEPDDFAHMIVHKVPVGTKDLEVHLMRGGSVAGRVVYLDGGVKNPLTSARVYASVADRTSRNLLSDRHIQTDSDGNFRFEHLSTVKKHILTDDPVLRHWKIICQDAMETVELHEGESLENLELVVSDSDLWVQIEWSVKGRVLDAATGEPPKKFRIFHCNVWSDGPGEKWANLGEKSGGSYEVTYPDSMVGMQIRVEAVDYEPSLSPLFHGYREQHSFDFNLTRSKGISGIVSLADGSPVQAAEVILFRDPIVVKNNVFEFGRGVIAKTDQNGRFSYSPQIEDHNHMLILHDQGYAELESDPLPEFNDITIEPWARIEGKASFGEKPAARQTFKVGRIGESGQRMVDEDITWFLTAKSDEEGHFFFGRVKAGKVRVSRTFKIGDGHNTRHTHPQDLELKPSETARVIIGGAGRPVVGRVIQPAGLQEKADWRWAYCELRPRSGEISFLNILRGELDCDTKSESERYAAPIRADGSFRVEDVPTDEYDLKVVLNAPQGRSTLLRKVATAERRASVPEMPEGRSNVPIDVGVLEMKMSKGSMPSVYAEEGILLGLDGSPLGFTEVIFAPSSMIPRITNNKTQGLTFVRRTWSDQEGRLSFPDDGKAYTFLVIHEQGFANMTAQEVLATTEYRLSAWSRVEGTLEIGGDVVAGEKVQLDSDLSFEKQIQYDYETITDDNGHFEFDKVMPGEWKVQWVINPLKEGYAEYGVGQGYLGTLFGYETRIVLGCGEAANVGLGGRGRRLSGRFARPSKVKGTVDWNLSIHHLRRMNLFVPGRPVHTHYPFRIDEDGAFAIQDVPPGNYQLEVYLFPPGEETRQITQEVFTQTYSPSDFPRTIAMLERFVTVKDGTNELDLGLLELNETKVGKSAATGATK